VPHGGGPIGSPLDLLIALVVAAVMIAAVFFFM
jgi:hypothetical protein